MRRLPLLTVGLMLFATSNATYGQNNFWTFPEENWTPGELFPGTLPTTSFGYTGAASDYAHAGIKDPYDETAFFVIDGELYNPSGVPQSLRNANSHIVTGNSEVLIVPRPGTCDQFYIFQSSTEDQGIINKHFPYVSIYHIENGLVTDPSTTQTAYNLVSDLGSINPTDWPGLQDHGLRGIHFAATRERDDGSRWVYVSNNQFVYRIDLVCDDDGDGLEYTGWKRTISPGNTESGWRNELEVYEDTTLNSVRIAAPYFTASSFSDRIQISVFDVDNVTGNFVPGTQVNIPLSNPPSQTYPYIHGIEFTPDGKGLYILHEPRGGHSGPLSFYNFTTSTLTALNFPGISNFRNSQLQISGESGNYELQMVSENYIGSLSEPNIPDVNNWNSTAIPLNTYPLTNQGSMWPIPLMDQHIVPDQIDYDDYVEDFFFQDCECCEKYAYHEDNMDTTYEATESATWSYGFGSNPWNAEVGDTIFIRSELLIPAGKSIQIQGMIFKFGPEGRLVVQKGTSGVNSGAILRVSDGSLLTADFRCAKRKYTCTNPEDDCSALKMWKGIIVEGHSNLPQNGTSGALQARLYVSENSTIEYAEVGIHVGRSGEQFSGGGIINIVNGVLKDCETGIEFEPYTRLSGSTELYNLSVVNDNDFVTTSDWLEDYEPNAFVVIKNSSGVRLKGNRYRNLIWTDFAIAERGTGVYLEDSRVLCDWLCTIPNSPYPCPSYIQSEFSGLRYGIYGINSGSTPRTLTANFNRFDVTQVGIFLSNHINLTILDNQIGLNKNKGSVGIYLLNSTGYTVQNNSLYTSPQSIGTSIWNTGIYIKDSGVNHNEIYRNTFENLRIGGRAHGVNMDLSQHNHTSGLEWICNTFNEPIRLADIYLSGSMAEHQGDCGLGRPAGNMFSHSSIYGHPGHHDLYASQTSHPYLTSHSIYYDHHQAAGSPSRIMPLVWTNANNEYIMAECFSIPYNPSTHCKVDKSGTPGQIFTEFTSGSPEETEYLEYADIVAIGDDFESQLAQFGEEELLESSDELSEVVAAKSKFWHNVSIQFMEDTLGTLSLEQMTSLLETYQPQIIERFASILLEDASLEWVDNSNLATLSTEMAVALPQISNEGLPKYIPEYFESDFFAVTSRTNSLNSWYLENSSWYHAEVAELEMEVEFDSKSNSSEQEHNSEDNISIQPNPFNEMFTVDISGVANRESTYFIEVFDIAGKKLYQGKFGYDQVTLQINGNNLPVGYLSYVIFENQVPAYSGKLLRIK
jgi:hypothetical protein